MMKMQRLVGLSLTIASGLGASVAFARPADASLTFCNQASEGKAAYVAIAYSLGNNNWKSQGWLNIQPGECATAVEGPLKNRYYYFGETDGDYVWRGDNRFCVSSKQFQLTGSDKKCSGANTRWEKFLEIDTKDSADFTMNLK